MTKLLANLVLYVVALTIAVLSIVVLDAAAHLGWHNMNMNEAVLLMGLPAFGIVVAFGLCLLPIVGPSRS